MGGNGIIISNNHPPQKKKKHGIFDEIEETSKQNSGLSVIIKHQILNHQTWYLRRHIQYPLPNSLYFLLQIYTPVYIFSLTPVSNFPEFQSMLLAL